MIRKQAKTVTEPLMKLNESLSVLVESLPLVRRNVKDLNTLLLTMHLKSDIISKELGCRDDYDGIVKELIDFVETYDGQMADLINTTKEIWDLGLADKIMDMRAIYRKKESIEINEETRKNIVKERPKKPCPVEF